MTYSSSPPTNKLSQLLTASPYQTYVYSYPHKTAYRPLNPPIKLSDVWSRENRDALFLYIHIPFCEMRCGFCNLFTMVQKDEDFVSQYVNTLKRQSQRVKQALGESKFTRFALGGGTPTRLSLGRLKAVLDIAENTMDADLQAIPGSVEVSPETATEDKLNLLRDRGIDRISIGVQSFIDAEVLAIQRRQQATQVQATLTSIKDAGFPTLNIDLIYGLPGQTIDTWLYSLHQALSFQPEEIYLYPLYVRPLTGMDCTNKEWDDIRLACYREGRNLLLAQGYQQISMRMFQKPSTTDISAPIYCCQADGMVGLGCGARSYTKQLHYASEYAVGAKSIESLLQAYLNMPTDSFDYIDYGFTLDTEDRQRRYILISLLSDEGLSFKQYRQNFTTELFTDYPELTELLALKLATKDGDTISLTELGIERSDIIGYCFFSNRVRQLMTEYELK
ncbi:Coproporphyrinogen III oxidase [Hyella patelloides LEGE 07179]|uniref:Heme chaperone HemW n=1 Tax=Hyella patelloides LEGE 07179 TaxID=945734 RepID=A0A563VNY4_9CYAN|nr:STM4012 family radical SAM protein [Hyella patelloides]VEP13178.1 Coproporphyrinogen III oxidase [Hyella patelloides LEGE 07179]